MDQNRNFMSDFSTLTTDMKMQTCHCREQN